MKPLIELDFKALLSPADGRTTLQRTYASPRFAPVSLMELDLKAPDHTTLSRRNKDVDVPAPTRVHDGPIQLIVDSTGLKISGTGEWHAHRHKSSKARRQWRKIP